MAVVAQSPRSNGSRYPQKPQSPRGNAPPSRQVATPNPHSKTRSASNPDRGTSQQEPYDPFKRWADSPQKSRQPASDSKLSADISGGQPKPEAEILFQKYFKSVGPRTYAAQLKRAGNGNHFLVLTEAKRDEKTDEVRKTRLFVFSEDFVAFFKMLHETAQFIRQNPVPDEVRERRNRFWNKKTGEPCRAGNGRTRGRQ
jgi:hypothetical protein